MIGPGRIGCFLFPWRAPFDNDPRVEFVVSKHPFPFRCLAQDQDHVREIGDDLAVVIEN